MRKRNICPDCRRKALHLTTDGLCSECSFKHGTVWVLDTDTYQWIKQERGKFNKEDDSHDKPIR